MSREVEGGMEDSERVVFGKPIDETVSGRSGQSC